MDTTVYDPKTLSYHFKLTFQYYPGKEMPSRGFDFKRKAPGKDSIVVELSSNYILPFDQILFQQGAAAILWQLRVT